MTDGTRPYQQAYPKPPEGEGVHPSQIGTLNGIRAGPRLIVILWTRLDPASGAF